MKIRTDQTGMVAVTTARRESIGRDGRRLPNNPRWLHAVGGREAPK